jgi:hypothetical protein
VPPLTLQDIRRQSGLAWVCLAALVAVAAWFWAIDKHRASTGTLAALAGCLGLILPPRERMAMLPRRLRTIPRALDAVPVLATLLVSPGYGVNWFYGANPYDELVHLVNGGLLGAVFGAMLRQDAPRGPLALAAVGACFGLVLGTVWECFEAATGLIGDWTDTWTDVALGMAGAVAGTVWAGRRWAGPQAAQQAAQPPPGGLAWRPAPPSDSDRLAT